MFIEDKDKPDIFCVEPYYENEDICVRLVQVITNRTTCPHEYCIQEEIPQSRNPTLVRSILIVSVNKRLGMATIFYRNGSPEIYSDTFPYSDQDVRFIFRAKASSNLFAFNKN